MWLVWLLDSFFVFCLRVAQDWLELPGCSCDAASCASAESVKGCFALSIRIVASFVPHLGDPKRKEMLSLRVTAGHWHRGEGLQFATG